LRKSEDTDDWTQRGLPEWEQRMSSHHAPSGPHQEIIDALIIGCRGQLGCLVSLIETLVQLQSPCVNLIPRYVATPDCQQFLSVLLNRQGDKPLSQNCDTRQ